MTAPAPSAVRDRLSAALRELRDRTGLSLAGLAAKTTFSKSSWERYLNGRTLPSRAAVEELCSLAGEPAGRCLALWELAESEWGGRAQEAAPPPPVPVAEEAAPPDHRRAAAVAVLASVCAVVVGAVAVALFLLPNEDAEPRTTISASPTGVVPLCRGTGCEGKDAMAQRCAAWPATLAERRTATGAWLQLRYSKECGTGWARMWGTRIGDAIEMTPGARHAEATTRADTDAYVYTLMTVTRPGTAVRACFTPAAGGGRECVEGVVR